MVYLGVAGKNHYLDNGTKPLASVGLPVPAQTTCAAPGTSVLKRHE